MLFFFKQKTAYEIELVTEFRRVLFRSIAEGVIGKEKWHVGFYDALMIAAANKMGCATVFTEDLNSGQKYGNVTAVNPFQG